MQTCEISTPVKVANSKKRKLSDVKTAASHVEKTALKRFTENEQQQQEQEENEQVFMKLDILMANEQGGGAGLNMNDLKKLMENGYGTVESLAFTTLKKLLLIPGIGNAKAERIKKAVEKLVPMGFQLANDFHKLRKSLIKISTGCSALDAALEGGIETGSITELFGEFRTGKSQICHVLSVMCQKSVEEGGARGKVMFIDTEGTFRSERIEEIARSHDMDVEAVLSNVIYARAYNSDHQMALLVQAAAILSSERFGLIIVDSATNLFRTDYQGRGELADRQQNLGKFLRYLQRLCDEYGVACVITNQVTASLDAVASYGGPQSKPIGGHVLAHACQTRLQLKKGQGDKRILKVIDSPLVAEQEAAFTITRGGVANID